MSCYASIAVLMVLSVWLQLSTVESIPVPCVDQQEFCTCPQGSDVVCEFKLEIEELQTFTSYVIKNKDLLSRGTPGDTYFLDSTGFHPAVPNDPELPEYGQCYFNDTSTVNVVFDGDFTRPEKTCSVPMTVDGVTYRRYIAVNGRIPGPTLIMTEGQIAKITVVNRLTSEAVTVHWHGMHQKDTPWMDGVGFVSQSPIDAGATFDYIFNATPAGSHWYHSHVGAQRTDGLFGALIVREKGNFFRDVVAPLLVRNPAEPYQTIYDIPSEHTLTLLDWQREASLDLFVKIHSTLGFYPNNAIDRVPTTRDNLYRPRTEGPDGIEVGPVPYWSGLINGRGKLNDTVSAPLGPLSVFTVTRDSAYRFRVIGAQSLYAYSFSIDDHKLRVIATDGHFVNPVEVDFIIVHSGERYDFVVSSYNQPQNMAMFWIRAETLEANLTRQHSALAILNYGNTNEHNIDWRTGYSQVTSSPTECSATNQCTVLNCPFGVYRESAYKTCLHLTTLTPLFPLNAEKLPKFNTTSDCTDCLKFFNFGFEGESTTSAINGKNFQLPVVPYQTNCGQYDSDREDPNIDTCTECQRLQPKGQDPVDCKCINVEQIVQDEWFDPNTEPKTVMMVFSAVGEGNLRDFAHPIHLHGHSFHVLYIGHGTYSNGVLVNNSQDVVCNGDELCMKPNWAGGAMPEAVINAAMGEGGRIKDTLIRKDTVIVPAVGMWWWPSKRTIQATGSSTATSKSTSWKAWEC